MAVKQRVLFLCTGNSARSQMAEGILRHTAGDRFDVVSAGTHPKGVHPCTIEVMNEIGIDVSTHSSKDVGQFIGQPFDHIITVCDRAKQQCPVFPGAVAVNWSFDDPADVPPAGQLETFRRVRDEIRAKIQSYFPKPT